MNLHARWSTSPVGGVGRAAVFVSIENLLDRRYAHFSEGAETFLAAPQDPFRMLAGVTIEY